MKPTNNRLYHELMEYSVSSNHHSLSPDKSEQVLKPRKASGDSLTKSKKMVLGILMASFFLYRLFYQQRREECIWDLLHVWTSTLNWLLNNNKLFYQVVLIIAQQSIQINILLLCIISTLRIKNLKAHFFMTLFYGTRGILLNIQRFPYPPHIIWEATVIPSLTVPYGISRDYFYSGHTGLMLFCTFWWKHLGYRWLYLPSLVLTPIVVLVLLSTRVHYSIDIVAAVIFTFWIQTHLLKHVIFFDKFFSIVLTLVLRAVSCIRKTIF